MQGGDEIPGVVYLSFSGFPSFQELNAIEILGTMQLIYRLRENKTDIIKLSDC